ncbi:MAG: ABC transporter ATP-binding protein [Bacteroidales bacterium]|nr:ABC transporter ATP-binding protein [Bacteroidales bacterium]
MIQLENINKSVGNFTLRDISLSIEQGSYTVILGDSGAGKSLLLEILAGIRRPDSGKILVDGVEVQDQPIQERPFGLVFQDLALFPHLSVRENIAFPLKMRRMSKLDVDQIIHELALRFEISQLMERSPNTLSGGERQRVALARTLAPKPNCLLLDEPLTALDTRIRQEIRGVLRNLNRSGLTIIHVTHDYQEALTLATHIGILEGGRLIQQGTAEEVLRNPINTFTASFTGIKNYIHVTISDQRGSGVCVAMANHDIPITLDLQEPAQEGYVIIPEEAIFLSHHPTDTSAANNFCGTITDFHPSPHGVEVMINSGIPLCALLTAEGVARLNLEIGDTIWASFKATSVRFIPK